MQRGAARGTTVNGRAARLIKRRSVSEEDKRVSPAEIDADLRAARRARVDRKPNAGGRTTDSRTVESDGQTVA